MEILIRRSNKCDFKDFNVVIKLFHTCMEGNCKPSFVLHKSEDKHLFPAQF